MRGNPGGYVGGRAVGARSQGSTAVSSLLKHSVVPMQSSSHESKAQKEYEPETQKEICSNFKLKIIRAVNVA